MRSSLVSKKISEEDAIEAEVREECRKGLMFSMY